VPGVVWSEAPFIIGAHNTGPLIHPKDCFCLAIPPPAAGKSLRGGRITLGEWEQRCGLCPRFVYCRTAPIFLLVPQVKLPKRLDLAQDAGRTLNSVPGLIVANWVEGKARR
jgi:hypothetical protein